MEAAEHARQHGGRNPVPPADRRCQVVGTEGNGCQVRIPEYFVFTPSIDGTYEETLRLRWEARCVDLAGFRSNWVLMRVSHYRATHISVFKSTMSLKVELR